MDKNVSVTITQFSGDSTERDITPLGIVAYYNADENGNTTVNDAFNAHTGTVMGTLTNFWKPGIIGSSLNFDGATNYVDIATQATLQLIADMSLSFWVNPTDRLANYALISKFNNDVNTEYNLWLRNDGVLIFEEGDNVTSYSYQSASLIPTGVKTHIVVDRDTVNQKVNFYINDVLDVSRTRTPATIATTTKNVNLGRRSDNSMFFKGMLDEVGIWNKVSTQARRDYMYNAGVGQQFAVSASGLIVPADNSINALYELPLGQGYQFMIVSDSLKSLAPQSQLKVTDNMSGVFSVGDVFVVKGFVKKAKIFGQTVWQGVCIKNA